MKIDSTDNDITPLGMAKLQQITQFLVCECEIRKEALEAMGQG